ncbi:MAG: aldo/keto reductase [Gemmobacter sp.]
MSARRSRGGGLEADLEASLRRLGTDHVDLFLLHSPAETDLTDGRLFDTLERIRTRGLARRVGVSCDNAAVGALALTSGAVTALQLPISELDDLRPQLAGRDIFVVTRGIVRARGNRSVREAFADAAADSAITTALVETSSETHLRALAGLP